MNVWPAVQAERVALIHDLNALTADQWATPSLCRGWSVADVVAHLIDSAKSTRLGFARDLARARFNFDKANHDGIARNRRDDYRSMLEEFRTVMYRTSTPPAGSSTRLVEAFVHGEDIRRPLAIHRDYPVDPVVVALRYQARTSMKWGGGKEFAAGLRLVPDPAPVGRRVGDISVGTGQEVRGPAISLLLAVSDRPVSFDEVSGPGAGVLVGRPITH